MRLKAYSRITIKMLMVIASPVAEMSLPRKMDLDVKPVKRIVDMKTVKEMFYTLSNGMEMRRYTNGSYGWMTKEGWKNVPKELAQSLIEHLCVKSGCQI